MLLRWPHAPRRCRGAEWKPWEVAEGHKVPLTVDKEELLPKAEKY